MRTGHAGWALALMTTAGCTTTTAFRPEVARLAIPADPCAAEGRAALASPVESATLMAGLPGGARAGGADPLQVGVEIIRSAAAAQRGARAADPVGRYATTVEDTLGIDLSVLADRLDLVDGEGARMANATLASPALADIVLRPGEGRSAEGSGLTLSRSRWKAFSQDVYGTTAREGWTAGFAQSLGEVATGARSADGAELAGLQRKFLVAAYMAAYFRNGAILSVSVKADATKAALLAKLKERIKDQNVLAAAEAEIDKFAAGLTDQVCAGKDAKTCVVLGTLGEQTFVTRAGKSYGFPGVSVAFDPTATKKVSTNKIAEEDIATDLVRVVLEAVGDELSRVPGVANSTLCRFDTRRCGSEVQAPLLAKVNDAGDRAEAAATGTVGTLIRGGWILSLNNEVLARTITVGAAVSLRKTAEAATWKRLQVCPAARGPGAPVYQTVALSRVE